MGEKRTEGPRYPGLYIKKVNGVFEQHANARLKELGLTRSQSDILRCIFERGGGPVTQKDIEEHLHLTHPTVIGLLHRLTDKGFVTSETDPADRRCRLIYLTKKHDAVHQTMEQMRMELERKMLSGFTRDETDTLLGLLDRVYRNIKR